MTIRAELTKLLTEINTCHDALMQTNFCLGEVLKQFLSFSKLLTEEGVINPLLEMTDADTEALSALLKRSGLTIDDLKDDDEKKDMH